MRNPSASEIEQRHQAIMRVACPACQAEAGKPCRRPSGLIAAMPHQERRSAAADAGVYEVK